MEKLVKIDPSTKHYTEVDPKKLERTAGDLVAFIKAKIPQNSDPHGIWQWMVPLCEGIINKTVSAPIPYSELPLKYQLREGLIAADFEDVYAPFANCVTGTPLEHTQEIIIGAEIYTYVIFED